MAHLYSLLSLSRNESSLSIAALSPGSGLYNNSLGVKPISSNAGTDPSKGMHSLNIGGELKESRILLSLSLFQPSLFPSLLTTPLLGYSIHLIPLDLQKLDTLMSLEYDHVFPVSSCERSLSIPCSKCIASSTSVASPKP